MRTKVFSVIFLFAVIIDSSFSFNETWIKNMKFEKKFIRAMEDYIDSQESVLQLLRKKLLNFKVEHWEAEENPETYFANELNRFLLLKRITSDTSQLSDKTLRVAEKFKAEVDSLKRENYFPSRNDLISSAFSLATLQKSQNLRTDKLAKGIFGEIKIRNCLSTEDCYQIGKQLNSAQEYSLAVEWQTEALKRFDDYYDHHQVKAVDILEELAISLMGNNQSQEAEKVVEKLSRMNAKSLAVKAFKFPVNSSKTNEHLTKVEVPKLCHPTHFLGLNSLTCPKKI